MIIDLFSFPLILLYAAFFGFTMKVADLLDEHGMRWFKGDALLFGFLWGFSGILLVLSRNDIANVILAMILAFLVRMRLDYRNHAIASTLIIITFLWKSSFDMSLFLIYFFVFCVFGGLRDYTGDFRRKKDWVYRYNEHPWYYIIPPAIYGMITTNWMIFLALTIYILFYELTKYSLYYFKFYRKL